MSVKNIYAVILAAGQSSRMGRFKALLRYSKTETFLSRLVKLYSTLTENEPVVVVNERLFKTGRFRKINEVCRFKTIINNAPEEGRFYSVYLGLNAVPERGFAFIHDVDRPFVKESTLNTLIKNKIPGGFVIPSFNGTRGHPILIGKKVIQCIQNCNPGKKKLNVYLKIFKKRIVQMKDEGVLTNINTMEEYRNRASRKILNKSK